MADSELRVKITGVSADFERTAENVAKAHAQLVEKLRRGDTIAIGSADRLIQQQELLRREIVKVYGSLDAATPEVIAHYRKIENAVAHAKGEIVSLNKITQDHKAQLNSAGMTYKGLSDTLENLAGKHGAVVAKASLVVKVLQEVYQVGKEVVIVFSTNDTLAWWDKQAAAVEKWGERTKKTFFDTAAAALQYGVTAAPYVAAQEAVQYSNLLQPIKRGYRAPYGPPSIDPMTAWANSIKTQQRLDAEAKEAADKANREAEANKRAADAIKQRTIALEAEIALLKESNPFAKAEIEYMRDLALATFEADSGLRRLTEARAALMRQGAIDSAFTDLLDEGSAVWGKDPLRAMMERSPGMGLTGYEWYQRFGGPSRDEIERLSEPFYEMELDFARFERAIEKWRDSLTILRTTLTESAVDFARTGGDNLGRIAGARFNELTAKGFDDLFAQLLGGEVVEGKDGGWRVTGPFGSSQVYASRADALNASRQRVQTAQAVVDFGSIGIGAYGAAQGAEGTRTGSVISGAASGASLGSVIPVLGTAWGAVIGAVVGSIGGYLGEKARQEDYKYGAPKIDMYGQASLQGIRNIGLLERDSLVSQVQENYNSARNSNVRLMMALGVQPAADTWKPIDLTFQPNPSANWLKHFNEMIQTGQIDAAVYNQARDQIKGGFANLGLGGKKFDALMDSWDNLDPAKMLQMLQGLAAGLRDVQTASEFFDARNGFGKNTSWFQGIQGVQKEMSLSFAQQIGQAFDGLLEKAAYLDDLVGDDQIALLQEIGSLAVEIREREREEMKANLLLLDQTKQKGGTARDRYAVMQMVDEEYSPDSERIASFYKGKADEALKKIGSAKTRDEAQRYYDEYMSNLDLVVQQGFSISGKTGVEWAKWASDQTWKGESAIAAVLEKFGIDAQNENAEFMAAWQPILDKFTAAGDAVTKLPDAVGGPVGRWKDQFEAGYPILTKWVDEMGNVVSGLIDFGGGLAGIIPQLPSGPLNPDGSGNNEGEHSAVYSSSARSEVATIEPEITEPYTAVQSALVELAKTLRFLRTETSDMAGAVADASLRLDDAFTNNPDVPALIVAIEGLTAALSRGGGGGDGFADRVSKRRSVA